MELLIVVTGTDRYHRGSLKTGLWLGESTHIYHCARERGYDIVLASPEGGSAPVDPMSLRPLFLDRLSAAYWKDRAFRERLRHTASLPETAGERFDCIYLAGGHGSMFDFPDNALLQALLAEQFESGRLVAAICHGVCGLLNVRLSEGPYLLEGRKATGYSWFEELLARRRKVVPFDLEAALKARGADYRKAWIPMTSEVVADGNLITGQNPSSAKRTAEAVVRALESGSGTRNRD